MENDCRSEGEGKDMPCLVTLVSEIRSWDGIWLTCVMTTCARRLLFSTRNSSLNSGMRLIYCRARISFLPGSRNFTPFLLQGSPPSAGSDATCQADSLLSIWGRPLSAAVVGTREMSATCRVFQTCNSLLEQVDFISLLSTEQWVMGILS